MISVGIDVSKGKSTVCFFKPGGEITILFSSYSGTASEGINMTIVVPVITLTIPCLFQVRKFFCALCTHKL